MAKLCTQPPYSVDCSNAPRSGAQGRYRMYNCIASQRCQACSPTFALSFLSCVCETRAEVQLLGSLEAARPLAGLSSKAVSRAAVSIRVQPGCRWSARASCAARPSCESAPSRESWSLPMPCRKVSARPPTRRGAFSRRWRTSWPPQRTARNRAYRMILRARTIRLLSTATAQPEVRALAEVRDQREAHSLEDCDHTVATIRTSTPHTGAA